MSDFQVSGRYFLFGSVLAGAVPSVGFGRAASLKALGCKACNERLNLAADGIGGRGARNLRGLLSENIVALRGVDSCRDAPTFRPFDQAADYVGVFPQAGLQTDDSHDKGVSVV